MFPHSYSQCERYLNEVLEGLELFGVSVHRPHRVALPEVEATRARAVVAAEGGGASVVSLDEVIKVSVSPVEKGWVRNY
jgi:hypothetical protein